MLDSLTSIETAPEDPCADRPLRIGFFSDTYAPSVNGISVSLQLLSQELRGQGHQVTIFAPRVPGHEDRDPQICRVPAMRYMQQPPVYVAFPGAPRTARALRECKFDVVHVHRPVTVGFLGYLTAASRHLPLVYTYHTSIADYTHYVKAIGRTRLARWAANRLSTTTTNLGDQIVVPSLKFKRILLAQRVRRPIHFIPNGIDLGSFAAPKFPGAFHRRLGLEQQEPILLYVGRLDPEKRLDFLIEAFARVLAAQPEVHLVLAGDGSSRLKLEQQARDSGCGQRIHFLGMVARADLPDLLHDATLFLCASTSEVHPIAMIEALAAGLPIAAVQDEAFEGMLVEGFNGCSTARETEAFGAAVSALLQDPCRLQTLARNSARLSSRFSIQAQGLALTGLYRAAIRENRPARSTHRAAAVGGLRKIWRGIG